jgi:hypothetical protein
MNSAELVLNVNKTINTTKKQNEIKNNYLEAVINVSGITCK